ncbi:MerC domain-containing protein [Chitinophaga sp. NPDC101104]|uniref:MerC domain-containing protein n=1 Tax=Chitinophaga sp. NPDC101104 TaxID=3390561 RepID=UPI003D08D70C
MPNNRLMNRMSLDALGIGASLACAVHCVALPLVAAFLPLAGVALHYEPLEYLLLGATPVVGLLALYRGYKYQHRRVRPSVLFVVGFALLMAGHFWFPEAWELSAIALGAGLLIAAHVDNIRFCRKCRVKESAPVAAE